MLERAVSFLTGVSGPAENQRGGRSYKLQTSCLSNIVNRGVNSLCVFLFYYYFKHQLFYYKSNKREKPPLVQGKNGHLVSCILVSF